MAGFDPPAGSQLLLYVDDLLIASPTKADCEKDTLALLKYLAEQGHKASKTKLQLCKEEVKYLGHHLSAGGRTIIESRKTAILQAPKPKTKKQMMSFLGLTNYCRCWVPNYAEIASPLSKLMFEESMKMSEPLRWTQEAEDAFCALKQALVSSTTLALPDYSKPFMQMVDCKGQFMTSVITQQHGDKARPIAFFSTRLDSVACAQPPCVRAIIAAALAVESSAHIVLFHPLVLKVPHAVSMLLLQTNMTFLSPARYLSCVATLLSQPHLTLERCTVLNPATLMPLPEDGTPHDCQELSEKIAKCRIDLLDQPLSEGEVIFVDGSSKKNELGKTLSGYAVVSDTKVLKAGQLPPHYSAQAAELVALTEACKLMKGQKVTIHTDSQYAFATVHIFAQHWKNRGMITSTGRPVTHATLLAKLLEAVQLPAKLAICKCAAHTGGTDVVSKGNAFADVSAKQAVEGKFDTYFLEQQTGIEQTVLAEMQQQSPQAERQQWINKGAVEKDGIFT